MTGKVQKTQELREQKREGVAKVMSPDEARRMHDKHVYLDGEILHLRNKISGIASHYADRLKQLKREMLEMDEFLGIDRGW